MKGDFICTVIVPKLQIVVPFDEVQGNPCSIELADKKAKFKQVDETGGGEEIKDVTFCSTYLHPGCLWSRKNAELMVSLNRRYTSRICHLLLLYILHIKLCPHN